MKKQWAICGTVFLFFIVLAAIVFRCAWGPDMVFSGSDMNIGLVNSAKSVLPEAFVGAYRSTPLLGNVARHPISVHRIGQLLLAPSTFANTWYAFYLIVSSLALIAYLRLWRLHWLSCLFGALAAFWVGSVTLSAAGHLCKLGVMALFTISLYLVEKSMRAGDRERIAYSLLAGACVGLMLLEQQDVGLLAGLFLGAYALVRLIMTAGKRWTAWLSTLIPIAIVGLILSGMTALRVYETQVTEASVIRDAQEQWNFVTQWSMVPSEWPDLIAPGYAGWHTGHPEVPYWGRIGQSPGWRETGRGFRNFRLDSLYIGILPVFFAVFGVGLAIMGVRKQTGGASDPGASVPSGRHQEERLKHHSGKRNRGETLDASAHGLNIIVLVWGVLAVLALLLAFGKYCPIYRLFYQLPLVGNIRAPIKFLHNFQVIIGILAAYGMHRLFFSGRAIDRRTLRRAGWIASGLALLMLFSALLAQAPAIEQRFAEWGAQAAGIAAGISRAWLHAAVMAGMFGCLVFLAGGRRIGPSRVRLLGLIPIAAVCFDSVYLTSRYFKADNVAAMRSGNPVMDYLKEHQGQERVFCFSQEGVYNMWISRDFLYHGINGFNFGQMPRMPGDYQSFLSQIGGNWHRLMQLSSCRYGLAPAPIYAQIAGGDGMEQALRPIAGFRFVRRHGGISTELISEVAHPTDQVLFEFRPALPRLALFEHWETAPDNEALARIASPEFDPLQNVVVSDALPVSAVPSQVPALHQAAEVVESDPRRIAAITSSGTGGILLFTQRYQPGWTVSVNGKPQPVLRCNYLNMGVHVPPGQSHVVFKSPQHAGQLIVEASALLLSCVAAGALIFSFKAAPGGKCGNEQ